MDIDSFAKAMASIGVSLAALKPYIDLIPNPQKKKEAKAELEKLEEGFKLAQVGKAKELGYPICERHWPPGIMVRGKDGERTCIVCGSKQDSVPGLA
jgi:hypothetical protein